MAVFLLLIFVMHGRWSPTAARRDQYAHQQAVKDELARLSADSQVSEA
jgi:hypothetical protein